MDADTPDHDGNVDTVDNDGNDDCDDNDGNDNTDDKVNDVDNDARSQVGETKILELEEELRVVANNLKSLEVLMIIISIMMVLIVITRWQKRRQMLGRAVTRSRSRR